MAHSILVVDDDPHIRDVVRFAFEKTGMAISIAQDGKEALARFDRTGWRSAARSGKPRIRRSCSCRRATRRSIESSASKSAATTM